jgi:calnexin
VNELPQKSIFKNDFGLVLKSKAKHAAISSRLNRPFVFGNKPLIVQYEVTLQDGQECGGSYLKLLSTGPATSDLKMFQDKTPYTIMFGPDKCGNDVKLHFIFRHKNPLNGSIEEKHCKKQKERLDEPFKDKQPHLYKLVLRPDQSFKIEVDHKIVNEGSLLTDFLPPVNPPKEIDDPQDKKPENWDEREKIPDPSAEKPDDWDESAPPQIPDPNAERPDGWLDNVDELIPDPTAEKPADWDTDIDGDWEAPLIPNPACEDAIGCGLWKAPLVQNPDYKGKWRAPLLNNPNYQGKWAPRKIPNPEFFEDLTPFQNMAAIAAVGFELWSMSSDILFDNIVITDNENLANEWAAETYDLKRRFIEKEAESVLAKLIKFTTENPWMWAVYLVVFGLPLSIILFLVCSKKEDKDESAAAKKTDAHNADQEQRAKTPKLSKSNLNEQPSSPQANESEEEIEDVEDDVDEEEIAGGEPAAANKPVDDDVEIIEEDAEPSKSSGAIRKRKPRKD